MSSLNIEELLTDRKDVPFELKGKKGTLEMQSPSAEVARELRHRAILISPREGETPTQRNESLCEFDDIMGDAVMACIRPDSPNANMSREAVQMFLMNIGGQSSEVAQYALSVCGLIDDSDDGSPGDHTDF